jgi:stage III sporulation protein AD
MDTVFRCSGAAMVAVVLILALRRQSAEIALLLSVLTCCMLLFAGLQLLQPVLAFLRRLQTVGELDSQMTAIVLKSVGLALLGEITGLVCKDSGNEALGKTMGIVCTSAVLYLSLPLFDALLSMIEGVLGAP